MASAPLLQKKAVSGVYRVRDESCGKYIIIHYKSLEHAIICSKILKFTMIILTSGLGAGGLEILRFDS